MQANALTAPGRVTRGLLVKLVRVIFRPVVQLLLRHGVTGLEIQEVVRWCCVDVALNEPEFAVPGRNVHNQTHSHAAILTGFTRVQVKRLAEQDEPEVEAITERASRIARVLYVWRTDARFHDEKGQPLALPLRGPTPSLHAIARREGRDTPVRALADALVAAGNAEWEGKRLRLISGVFVPEHHSCDDIAVMTQISADFMFSLQQCFDPDIQPQPRFRHSFLHNIAADRLGDVREELYAALSDFNGTCHSIMKKYRTEEEENVVRVGVGAYSFIGAPDLSRR